MRKISFATIAVLALSAGPVLAAGGGGAPQSLIDQSQTKSPASVLQAERDSGTSGLAQVFNWLFHGGGPNAEQTARAPAGNGQPLANG